MSHPEIEKVNERDCRDFVINAAAFMRFAYQNKLSESVILETLIHDIGGLSRGEKCFCPRVEGYFCREYANRKAVAV